MKDLHKMKEMLMAQVQAQMGHLEQVDTKELGEAIDMIKDLSEAIYYCTITEAMEGKEGQQYQGKEKEVYYYPMYYPEGNSGGGNSGGNQSSRMYYDGRSSNGGNSNSSSGGNDRRNYWDEGYQYPMDMGMWKDEKEGRSPHKRRMYMESKENHHDKTSQIQNLEQYMKELSSDVVEMIQGSSPEEKQLLKSKLTTLISKIDHV